MDELSSHDHGNCELCDSLERKLAEAQALLAPANPQETLIGAIRNLQQAYISAEGNCETLEAKLAEAQAETATAYRNMKNYQALMAYANEQNDSLRSCISELEGERDALKATLEQAREALLAWKAFMDIFHDDHGEYKHGWQVAMITAKAIADKLTKAALAALGTGKPPTEDAIIRPGGPWPYQVHGKSCPKLIHNLTLVGYLHGANDDRTYDVDGVVYCGRCHAALDVEKKAPVDSTRPVWVLDEATGTMMLDAGKE